ncbi:MAG: hypothetical protein KKA07_14595, partial [Bacteroidetes bacterium]|nr:hypothetical protein [Bacteroidota bacterium]
MEFLARNSKIVLFSAILLICGSGLTQAQPIRNLFFNSSYNVARGYFNNGNVTFFNTNTTAQAGLAEGVGHAEDKSGNVKFYSNANGIYDRNYGLMSGSAGIYCNPSSSEMAVCQFPNDTNKYYIIYNDETCSPLYYSVVDMTQNSGFGDVTLLNQLYDNNSFGEVFEVVKIPCRDRYWLLTYDCNAGFKRFLIDSTGIHPGVLIYPHTHPGGFDGRGEMDYHNGKIAISFTYATSNQVFVADFDAETGTMSNGFAITIPGNDDYVHGLEFSPDANKLYIADWYLNYGTNLRQYDLSLHAITNSWQIVVANCGSSPYGIGHIEQGPNGKLYVAKDRGCGVLEISDADSDFPTFDDLSTDYMLSLGISDFNSSLWELTEMEETQNICASGATVVLTAPTTITHYEWIREDEPGVVLGTNSTLTVTAGYSDVYVVTDPTLATGCKITTRYVVEGAIAPGFSVTADDDTICRYQSIGLSAIISPSTVPVTLAWNPTYWLDNSTIANPIATPTFSTWFRCDAVTPGGCWVLSDSVYIEVQPGDLANLEANSDVSAICPGDTAHFSSSVLNVIFQDYFTPDTTNGLWTVVSGGVASTTCGSVTGRALYFNGAGSRIAATKGLNVATGATIHFALKIPHGTPPCDQPETGENVMLEYSINNGATWFTVNIYQADQYPDFTYISASIPTAAKTANTRFRWKQFAHSGAGQDNWVIDDIYITTDDITGVIFEWEPPLGLADPSGQNTEAYPGSTTDYTLYVSKGVGTCQLTGQIPLTVGFPFTIASSNDTTVCSNNGVQLSCIPTPSGSCTYNWAPASLADDATSGTPTVFPLVTTTFSVTATMNGCQNTDAVTITIPYIYDFGATATSDSLCFGDTITLDAHLAGVCGLQNSTCSSVSTGQLGSSSSTSSTSGITIYAGLNKSQKVQYIYRLSEMEAAGLSSPSTLTQIGFRISAISGSNVYQNFIIKMGCVDQENMSIHFQENLQTVFNAKPVLLTTGINYYTLDFPYDWDGESSLIVEVCYDNAVASANSTVYITTQAYNASLASFGTANCNATTGTTSFARPNTYLKFCSTTPHNDFVFAWAPSTWLSDPTAGQPTCYPEGPIEYTIRVTDTVTGCIFIDSISLTASPDFTLNTAHDQMNCTTNGVMLTADPSIGGTYNYFWSPDYELSSNTAANPTATPQHTTTYSVTVSSPGGCHKTDTARVNVPVSSLYSFGVFPVQDTVCLGESAQLTTWLTKGCGLNGSTCIGSTSTAQMGYSTTTSNQTDKTPFANTFNSVKHQYIYPATEISSSGIPGARTITSIGFRIQSISGTNVYQNFTIKIGCTDQEFCTTTFNSSLGTVFNPKPVVITNGINYFTLDQTYDWDGLSNMMIEVCFQNPTTSQNSTVYYSTTAFYSSSYTSGASVCSSASGTQSYSRPITYLQYCMGTSEGDFDYTWSPGTGLSTDTISDPIATPQNTTVYTLTVTEPATGCELVDSSHVEVTFPIEGPVDLGNDTVFCPGNNVTLTIGSYPSITWSDGSHGNSFVVTAAGTYWVEVTTSCGIDRDTIDFSDPLPFMPLFLGNDTTICDGTTMTLGSDQPSLSHLWSTGETTQSISVSPPGTYWLDLSNGCTTLSDTIVLNSGIPPIVDLGNDSVLCSTAPYNLDATNQGATYIWSNGSSDPEIYVSETDVYWVNVTTLCGTAKDTVYLRFMEVPDFLIAEDATLCNGAALHVGANCDSCDFLWSTTETTDSIWLFATGTYWVQGTNYCGTETDTVTVIAKNTPSIDLGHDTSFCNSVSLDPDASFPGSTYLWSTGSTAPSIHISAAGTYWAKTENECGSDRDTISVSLVITPLVNLGPDRTLCDMPTYRLDPLPGITGTCNWSTGSTDTAITVNSSGIYWLEVTNGCGVHRDSILVLFRNRPVVNLGPDIFYCDSIRDTLNAYWPFSTYLWSTGSTDSAITVNNAGGYSVTVSNVCGSKNDAIVLSLSFTPEVNCGNDTVLCNQNSFIIDPTTYPGSYHWNTGSTDTTLTVTMTGLYHVTVTNACGTDADTVWVRFMDSPFIEEDNDTTLCNGVAIQAWTSCDSCSFLWSTGETTDTI